MNNFTQTKMDRFTTNLFRNLTTTILLLSIAISVAAQNDTPCECGKRWTGGAHWNPDGTINDAPNAPSPLGIIRCGSSAETQSQIAPGNSCVYNPNQFAIDISLFPCIDPSTGNVVTALNPTAGQPIIWLNFDVRPNAGSFQVQINDNSGDKIAWALYHSTSFLAGVNPNGLSGNCNALVLAACGVESSNTWNTLPVPNFSQPTNYYLAIWDQDADGDLQVNNFKARFGCGDADVLICNLEVGQAATDCQEDTYTVAIPIKGINGNYIGYDPNATPPTSAPVCLTNSGTTNVTSGTIIMTYPQDVANYNIEISIDPDPNDDCPEPQNPDNCSATVTGTAPLCCKAPELVCPPEKTIACEESIDPANTGAPTVSEGCGQVNLEHEDEVTAGTCTTETTILRTWTATDENGNTATCTQTIHIQDNTAPLAPPAPEDITVSCGSLVPEAAELIAVDNCEGDVLGLPSSSISGEDCVNDYVIERLWTFSDACGNTSTVSQKITVRDDLAPATPEAPEDVTVQCPDDVPAKESLTTTDNCDGEITADPTDEIQPGRCVNQFDLIRTWTFTDACGNSTSVSQTIKVLDTTPPATPIPPANITVDCADDVPLPVELTALDNCDGEIKALPTEVTTPGSCANDFVLVRTWTFTDKCGNNSSINQKITVKDSQAPSTPEAPEDETVQCAEDVPAAVELTASDNCSGEIVVLPTETTTTGLCANDYVLVRTWTFADECGNNSSVQQTITVKDTEAPVAPPAPDDLTVQCPDDVPTDKKALTAVDNCDGEITVEPVEEIIPGSCANDYTIVCTWTFTDQCGNSSSVQQKITVKDTQAPSTPEAPEDETVQCADDVPAAVELTASDNCDGDIKVLPTEVKTPGNCPNEFVLVRTWTFADDCGNGSSVQQTITVKDTEAPVAPPAPDDLIVQCPDDVPTDKKALTAVDNCDGEITVEPTEEVIPGACANDYVIICTWTFTDQCGNSSSVQQKITVKDTQAPSTPEAPEDESVQCADDVPAAVELTASDNCDGEITVLPIEVKTPGSCPNEFVLVRTWTFADDCGNSSSVQQTITVKDTEAPVAPPAPDDLTVQCPDDVPTGKKALTAVDNCDGEITVEPVEEIIPGSCANAYTIVCTWTFTDQCGNTSSVKQTIRVKDTTAPVPPAPPAKVVVQCPGDVPAPVNLTAQDNCDGPITVAPTEKTTPGSCPNDYTLVRTWTFVDACGNKSSVSQKIRVKDTKAPVAPAAPQNATVQCADEVPAAVELTAADNCDGAIKALPKEVKTPGLCPNEFVLVRTWIFKDKCGNTSSVKQTITVKDTQAPSTPEAPEDETVQCADDVPAAVELTASDNCDGEITVLPTEVKTPGSCPNEFVLVRTWTFADDCGNSSSVQQTITVKDTKAPVAPPAPDDLTVQCPDDVPTDKKALTAVDNCDGEITVEPVEEIIPGSCANDYTIVCTWTFTDQCGNTSSVKQTIRVKDTTAPVPPAPPAKLVVQCPGDVPAPVNLTAQDNCDGPITVAPTEKTTPGSCPNDYTLVRTWTFVDACGNKSSVSQKIRVKDTKAPVAPAAPQNATVQCADEVPAAVELTAADNCDGAIKALPKEVKTPGLCPNEFVLVRTWTFKDKCGNSSSVKQTITVKDTQAPSTPEAPEDESVQCADDVPAAVELTASDNCDGEITVLPTEVKTPGSCPNEFVLVRTWTFADDCGNSSSVQQTITVKDTEAPVAPPAPDDLTVQCSDDVPTDKKALTAVDNCDGEITVEPVEEIIPGSCANDYTIVCTWTFTDQCGNTSMVQQKIRVQDTTPPATPEPPADITVQCPDDIPPPVDLTTFDNCDGEITVSPLEAVSEPGVCASDFSVVRTWVFVDQCGNSTNVSQTITVKDDTAPVLLVELGLDNLSCVDDIPPAEEVLELIGEAVFDNCVNALPTVSLVGDTGDPLCIDGVFSRTYSFEVCDGCGNCVVYPLTYSGSCGEFCTLTQGGWGNAGGKYPWPDADGKATTTEIITALMEAYGEIVIGDPATNALRIQDPACVLALLPGGGSAIVLPDGNNVANEANDCVPFDQAYLNKQGRLTNSLAAQSIALQLNIWYSSLAKGTDLGGLSLGGACLPLSTDKLPGSIETVQDLLDYANQFLSGKFGLDKDLAGALISAVSGINEYFDGCKLPPVFNGEQPEEEEEEEETVCATYCTLTQGGWGNTGGKYPWNNASGKAGTADIISALLQKYGPVVLGDPAVQSLTVKDAECVLSLLPGGGKAAVLPKGHVVAAGNKDCKVYDKKTQNNDGTLKNILATQTLALQLNIWYGLEVHGSDLGALEFGTDCLPIEKRNLPPSINSVKDLLNYANIVLSGKVGNDYLNWYLTGQIGADYDLPAVLNDAVTKVNEYFGGCSVKSAAESAPAGGSLEVLSNSDREGLRDLALRPNPASDQVEVRFYTQIESKVRLRITDMRGSLVYEDNPVVVNGLNTFEVNTTDFSPGLFIVSILQDDRMVQQKLVVVRN